MSQVSMSVAVLALTLAVLPASAGPPPVRVAVVDTGSLLAPSDSGYADAVAFARFLEGRGCGFHVERIGRSQLSGFLGEWRSASYRTDRGNFAVVFFPAPDGAERVRITSEVRGGHYLYTFRTHQPGLRRVEKEDHDAPQRFVVHGRWFIFVWDGNTAAALQGALAGS